MKRSRGKKDAPRSKPVTSSSGPSRPFGDSSSTPSPPPKSDGKLRARKTAGKNVKSVVDGETRRQVHLARLEALDSDNHQAPPLDAQDLDSDPFEEDTYSPGVQGKAKKAKKGKGKRGSSSKPQAAPSTRNTEAKVLDLTYLMQEEEDYHPNVPTYFSAAASESCLPARKFCSVCGFISQYTCVRCGLFFCSLRCQSSHEKLRCMKFGAT
eukprot:gb/GEZN01016432.1/.p1 GENE.gb/GEZN01016432.1/~~gb/GEZN01016432.1/.p1  ORF type:complete len:210 (+),score=30.82 gb/GEZN01016432.1/:133-762(+)